MDLENNTDNQITTDNYTTTDNKSTVVSGDDLWGFMEKFPKILDFIMARSYAEVIINANIVIVNVRNIIGWNNDGNTFTPMNILMIKNRCL
jgi:hypothetical protein